MRHTFSEISKKVINFRDKRNWKQFHNPKDSALSLVLEATEVMEHFQWKTNDSVHEYIKDNKIQIADELADVFYWVVIMCNDFNIDLLDSVDKKLKKTALKYPISRSKGNIAKYNKL